MKSCVRWQIRRKDSSLDLSRRTFSARGGGAFAPIAPPCLRAWIIYVRLLKDRGVTHNLVVRFTKHLPVLGLSYDQLCQEYNRSLSKDGYVKKRNKLSYFQSLYRITPHQSSSVQNKRSTKLYPLAPHTPISLTCRTPIPTRTVKTKHMRMKLWIVRSGGFNWNKSICFLSGWMKRKTK